MNKHVNKTTNSTYSISQSSATPGIQHTNWMPAAINTTVNWQKMYLFAMRRSDITTDHVPYHKNARHIHISVYGMVMWWEMTIL